MNEDHKTQSAIMSYIDVNPIATLGTLNPDGTPHGAVVYVCTDTFKLIVYFITKNQTRKYTNLSSNNKVSLTIVHPSDNSTLQASGTARDIEDPLILDATMKKLTKLHVTAYEWLPPIAKIRAGAYTLVGITLEWARLAEFEGMSIGDERIFTQMQH
ncbi:MAG TPA: pyridoxamine 5'-phosphate oxidase family protein [Candidatus Saccharimonadales bacterium]